MKINKKGNNELCYLPLPPCKKLDPKPVEDAVKLVHDKESSLFKYNNENA